MLIEFVGTTGAGKTSLVHAVERQLADCRAVTASDLVTGLVGLRGVENATLRNLTQEILGLGPLSGHLTNYTAFLRAARRSLAAVTPWLAAVCCARAVERTVGVDAISRRRGASLLVLVDEGPILAAHAVLLAAGKTGAEDVARLAAALPWPDLCVWVRAVPAAAVARTLRRRDAPRELRLASAQAILSHVHAADALYERLLEGAPQGQVLAIDNSDSAEGAIEAVAGFLAGRLRAEFQAAAMPSAQSPILHS